VLGSAMSGCAFNHEPEGFQGIAEVGAKLCIFMVGQHVGSRYVCEKRRSQETEDARAIWIRQLGLLHLLARGKYLVFDVAGFALHVDAYSVKHLGGYRQANACGYHLHI